MSGSERRIRVVLADDHRLLRDALKSVLAAEFEIVGEAETGEAALAAVLRTKPDVVVLDIRMPGIGGLAAAHRIAQQVPSAKVLILSQYDDEEYVVEALNEAGAAGYLLKTDAASELLSAIRAVHSGKRYLSPSAAPVLLNQLKRGADARLGTGGLPRLTRREREILKLVGQGATSKEIAARLNISPKTAQVHRDNLKQKLDLHTTAELVRYAIKLKLIRLD